MDRLRQFEVFVAVAQARSFTAASARLGMSRANVTKHVSALERRIGTRLLNRTTQHVAPTEAGFVLLERGRDLLDDVQALEAELRGAAGAASGIVRIGVPPSFGAAHLVPALAAFQAEHPGAQVVLSLDRGDAELVRDGLDLTLRIATTLRDTSYIARLLCRVPQVLVASPAYLARFGEPRTLAELREHRCLVHRLKSPNGEWRFEEGGRTLTVPVTGPLTSDFGEALRSAALIGQGISMHPTYMVGEDVERGDLRVVLPDLRPSGLAIHAIYPQRSAPARVKVVIEFLVGWLRREARWLPEIAPGAMPTTAPRAARRARPAAPR